MQNSYIGRYYSMSDIENYTRQLENKDTSTLPTTDVRNPLVWVVEQAGEDTQNLQVYLGLARRLIKAGQDVDAPWIVCSGPAGKLGTTALMLAVEENLPEFVELLLDAGADPDSTGRLFSCPPLHTAALNGYIEVGKLLIQANCDLNSVCNIRTYSMVSPWRQPTMNPLHCAISKKHFKFAEMLLRAGVKVGREKLSGVSNNESFGRQLEDYQSNPPSLLNVAVRGVRGCMRGPNFGRKVATLELPGSMKLMLRDIV